MAPGSWSPTERRTAFPSSKLGVVQQTVFRGHPSSVRREAPGQLGEVAVGPEPRCVAVSPDDSEAYVTSSGQRDRLRHQPRWYPHRVGRDLGGRRVAGLCADAERDNAVCGRFHRKGLRVRPLEPGSIVRALDVGGNPEAIAITNNGDLFDTDETVFRVVVLRRADPGRSGRRIRRRQAGRGPGVRGRNRLADHARQPSASG